MTCVVTEACGVVFWHVLPLGESLSLCVVNLCGLGCVPGFTLVSGESCVVF